MWGFSPPERGGRIQIATMLPCPAFLQYFKAINLLAQADYSSNTSKQSFIHIPSCLFSVL